LGSCGAKAQANFSEQTHTPFVEPANYNPAIPTPESITGHGVAEKAVRYPALIRYLQALAKVSERVTLTAYGRTHEGRTLYYVTITSRANHKRLDQIKANFRPAQAQKPCASKSTHQYSTGRCLGKLQYPRR
jgi:hypothetical protein